MGMVLAFSGKGPGMLCALKYMGQAHRVKIFSISHMALFFFKFWHLENSSIVDL